MKRTASGYQHRDDVPDAMVHQAVTAVLRQEVIRARRYVSPSLVIRVTRKRWGKKIATRGNVELTVTIGRPNFAERQAIRTFRKAGEPFPVKRLFLEHPRP